MNSVRDRKISANKDLFHMIEKLKNEHEIVQDSIKTILDFSLTINEKF